MTKEQMATRRRNVGRITGLLAAGLLATSMMTATSAWANETDEAEAEAIAFYEANMERFDVPQELRDSLLAKALSGATLDADIPGAVPVSTDVVVNDYGTYPVNRYPDGSFDSLGVSEEVDLPSGGVTHRAIKNCTSNGGAGGTSYTGCQVYHWTFWHNMYFNANYSRASNAGSISYMGERGFDSGSSCQTEVFAITKKTGTNASPAKAEWTQTCTDLAGASMSKTLGLRVSGTVAESWQNY